MGWMPPSLRVTGSPRKALSNRQAGQGGAIVRNMTVISGRPARRVDRVAAFGAVVALAGCLLVPFAEFRANRIVSGAPEPLSSAGTAGWLLLALAVAAFGLSVAFRPAWRGRGILILGAGLVALMPWALGFAAVSLLIGAGSPARVSIGSGAWLVMLGGAIIWFAGARGLGRSRLKPVLAVAVIGLWVSSAVFGGVPELSLAREYAVQSTRFWGLVREHLMLSGLGLAFGTLIGVPLGALASRNNLVRSATLSVVGVIQTVPSLALLGLLVFPLAAVGLPGIGTLPATIALTLYALLPIVRNTYVGLAGVDEGALDAGRGMGMSKAQLLLRVEAPLALPLVLEGVRAAAVLVIGIAAVTAFVGAGGLGILVFQGWGQQADDLTLLGALPMVALALFADLAIRGVASVAVSPGIRQEEVAR